MIIIGIIVDIKNVYKLNLIWSTKCLVVLIRVGVSAIFKFPYEGYIIFGEGKYLLCTPS